jgi:hypothetical protein
MRCRLSIRMEAFDPFILEGQVSAQLNFVRSRSGNPLMRMTMKAGMLDVVYLSTGLRMRKLIFICLLSLVVFKASSQDVYKTPSGKKYHLASCRMVENVSEKITVEKAIALGLEPCKICKPETVSLPASGSNKAQGQSATTQCKGYTKAGTRCRHMTRIANGYCYQHQP